MSGVKNLPKPRNGKQRPKSRRQPERKMWKGVYKWAKDDLRAGREEAEYIADGAVARFGLLSAS
jgi:hypothetical protein